MKGKNKGGRPPVPKRKLRDKFLCIRLSTDDKRDIAEMKKLCKFKGSLGEFVRQQIFCMAEKPTQK